MSASSALVLGHLPKERRIPDKLNMNTARRQATILVVDDDAPIRALVAQVLESRGYEVLVAADSTSALRVASGHPSAIHLLLTDIMMPHGNGIALARAFLDKWPETRVLYMSGFEPETLELVQNGAAPEGLFLAKPFTPRQLIEHVQTIVPLELHEKDAPPSSDLALPSTGARSPEQVVPRPQTSEAVYRLESEANCPQCGAIISTLKVIRLLRTQVNFISTLPRRGRVAVCPECLAILPAELTNF
jgi:CheY-like chemotaxis protein